MACDSLLEVPAPPVVPPTALNNPALSNVLVQGAVADFECALANYIVATALLTDELQASSNLGGVVNWDRRREFSSGGATGCVPDNSFGVGVYAPLSTARFQADDAFRRLLGFRSSAVPDPGRAALLAQSAAYAGYSYAVMGEGFCEAAFDLSDALPWWQVLQLAEQRFDTALSYALESGVDSITNFVLVGRARVRLDLGDTAAAVQDASLVPEGFEKHATYSTSTERRWNRVFSSNPNASVDLRFRNLDVEGAPDTRIPVTGAGKQAKYVSQSSSIVIASWREAQLILAEAKGGQLAVDAINRARGSWGLPPFASNDPDSIVQQVRIERQRELFLQGHRLNDMLRFGIPFDTLDHTGAPMGTLTCLRLPSVELDNNPNIRGARRTTRD